MHPSRAALSPCAAPRPSWSVCSSLTGATDGEPRRRQAPLPHGLTAHALLPGQAHLDDWLADAPAAARPLAERAGAPASAARRTAWQASPQAPGRCTPVELCACRALRVAAAARTGVHEIRMHGVRPPSPCRRPATQASATARSRHGQAHGATGLPHRPECGRALALAVCVARSGGRPQALRAEHPPLARKLIHQACLARAQRRVPAALLLSTPLAQPACFRVPRRRLHLLQRTAPGERAYLQC